MKLNRTLKKWPVSDGSFVERFTFSKVILLLEAAAQVVSNPQPSVQSDDFSATITETLQNLSLGAQNLQNPFTDADLMGMFGGEGDNGILPFMQGMMQSLLSKEVLYPSLKVRSLNSGEKTFLLSRIQVL